MISIYFWFVGIWAILAKMTIAGLVIAGLLFVAFVPVSFFPTVLRKWALYAAALVTATTVAYSVGVHDEHVRVEKQLAASVAAETKQGNEARTRAVNTIKRDTPAVVRDDPANRDRHSVK